MRRIFASIFAVVVMVGLAVGTAEAAAVDPAADPARVVEVFPAQDQLVGIAAPVIVTLSAPVADRAGVESQIAVRAGDAVLPGKFEWLNDHTVSWQSSEFLPAHSQIRVQAPGTDWRFNVGRSFTALGNRSTHRFIVSVNGNVARNMPASFGKPGRGTPAGWFPVMDKNRQIWMDSSTYGVPVNSREGYRLLVDYAVRLTSSGIFVHSAPWSTGQQGNSNVSHGCINLSPANAQWYFNNVLIGDPVQIV